MPSSFLQSVFNSNPSSPQLSYHPDNTSLVKNDHPSEFMDYLIPFSSSEKSTVDADTILQHHQQFDSGDIRINDLAAAGSPLLTSETLSSPENSSFGSDNTTEVDDAFISQISCFSRLPNGQAGASNNAISSPSSIAQQQQAPATSQSAIFTAALTQQSQIQVPLASDQNRYGTRIFARSLPWVLSTQPPDIEDWVEWSGTMTICGRPVQLGGWEPPEGGPFTDAQLDLSNWVPWSPTLLDKSPLVENKFGDDSGSNCTKGNNNSDCNSNKSKQMEVVAQALSVAKARRAEASKTWARRVASNRLMPGSKKRRRVETVLPIRAYEGAGAASASASKSKPQFSRADTSKEDSSGIDDGACTSGVEQDVQPGQEDSANKEGFGSENKMDVDQMDSNLENKSKTDTLQSEPQLQLNIPEYIYPQPAIARAITQRAAEDVRTLSIAEHIQQQEITDSNPEAADDYEDPEETRRLMDEFLLLPDDTDTQDSERSQAPVPAKEVKGSESASSSTSEVPVRPADTLNNATIKPLPSLSSPVSALSIGVRQGLRQTRSLLEYSASTRRRALVHFRSEVLGQAQGGKSLSRKVTADEEKGGLGGKRRKKDALDALEPSKFVLDENQDTSFVHWPTVRVRAS